MGICDYLGIELEYVVWGLAGVVVLLLLLLFINMCMIAKLKKKYKKFMGDTDAKSLEEKIAERLEQLDDLVESHYTNKSKIEKLENQMNVTFQKIGLVKYDAFNEMGGKLSFSLALLNEKNDGFVINAMHSREGCYTYIKEIIAGKSIIVLASEEKEALDMALNYKQKMLQKFEKCYIIIKIKRERRKCWDASLSADDRIK